MSRRGDDEGFHPHPGDPWHPEWSSERENAPEPEEASPADETAPAASAPPVPHRRRLGFGRRRERAEAPTDEESPEEAAAPPQAEEPDLAGWWAAEGAVDETAWEERAAEAAAEAVAPEEAETETAPSAPLLPWWGTAAPAILPAVPEAAAPVAPAARAPETPAGPGAAAVIPLDLPPRPMAPPPGREPAEGAAAPEPGGEGSALLPEGSAAVPPESIADELARATAALLAELGEEPRVERLAEAAVEPAEAAGEPAELPVAAAPGFALEPDRLLEEEGPVRVPRADAPEDLSPLASWQPEGPASLEIESLSAEATGLVLPAWEVPIEEAPAGGVAADTRVPPAPEVVPAAPARPAAAPPADEVEVDEWLAFVEGLPAGTVPPAARLEPAPAAAQGEVAGAEIEVEESLPPVAGQRRGGWLRRRRRAEGREAEPAAPIPEEGAPEPEPAAEAEEAHRPPPWAPPAPFENGSPAAAVAGAELEEAAEAEAAWLAWEAGEAAPGVAAPAVPARPEEPPPTAPPQVRAVPAPRLEAREAEEESGWEEAEWGGEPAPSAEEWYGAEDEDEVTAPQAVLPEEEWEEPEAEFPPRPPEAAGRPGAGLRGAQRREGAAPGEAAAEEWEAEGWEVFPEPGELPRRRGPGMRPEPSGVVEPAAEEELEIAGWETFPEPGTRPPAGPAAAPRGGAGPRPEPVFSEDEEETAEEWPEAGSEEEYVEPGYPEVAPPVTGEGRARRGRAGIDEPTLEIPTPAVYPFGAPARRLGPISEEVLAGASTMEHRGLAEEIAAADTSESELQALSAPMLGLESGVVGFEDVAHLGHEEEAAVPVRSDLPVRVATGMVLAALLLGSLWVGGEFLAGFVGLMVILGLGEFYAALRRRGHQPLALFGFLGAAGLLAGSWFYGPVAIPVAAVAATILSFFYYAFAPHRRDALTNGSLTILGMLWVAGTAAFAFPIAASPDFRVLILALAATVIANDVGAFFTGRAWGARPMAPVLSPHKTWEGLAGGVVLGIAMAVGAGYYFDEIGIRAGAALGLVVAVMAPLGDLAESMIKRSLGVKDMGAILPGHGGILDRIDAFLFVLPAAWVLFETTGLLR